MRVVVRLPSGTLHGPMDRDSVLDSYHRGKLPGAAMIRAEPPESPWTLAAYFFSSTGPNTPPASIRPQPKTPDPEILEYGRILAPVSHSPPPPPPMEIPPGFPANIQIHINNNAPKRRRKSKPAKSPFQPVLVELLGTILTDGIFGGLGLLVAKRNPGSLFVSFFGFFFWAIFAQNQLGMPLWEMLTYWIVFVVFKLVVDLNLCLLK